MPTFPVWGWLFLFTGAVSVRAETRLPEARTGPRAQIRLIVTSRDGHGPAERASHTSPFSPD
jgi:hypothetical protein